ncbi:GNAT family N-acetyltransferase [Pseudoroseicyclus tamaricis]|uniref:GNAT family N-acetyltransferase n=1 Tax=Pseudoroseicyclus tamaricis TaxID=2705421 RepID=A0A6B2JF79_9RHOB|nr:GNAT family N-acetyltransferase [Pseudoroseicyclus tamaricis]NDU99660.1 GNAT family N-acetyltransferase [Pseudoroseicyclus tamaricis]
MTELLDTPRLVLRRPNAADWPAARDFFMSDRSRGIGGPVSLGAAWRALAAEIGHWDMRGYGMWTVTLRDSDAPIGMVGPWYPEDWPETEVGWMIWSAEAEGKGYAYEAAQAAIAHAWAVLGWETIVSYIDPQNHRSIALAERLGALQDMAAQVPRPETPCLVYRHPRPEARP